MKCDKLLKLLKLVGRKEVRDYNFSAYAIIRDYVINEKGKFEFDESFLSTYGKRIYPEVNKEYILKYDSWSTYSACIEIEYYVNDNNKLIAGVTCYNGDRLCGERTNVRFKIDVELPLSYLKNIDTKICNAANHYFDNMYEIMLQNQRDEWIKKQIDNFLNEDKN
jgi:hypothetical protein